MPGPCAFGFGFDPIVIVFNNRSWEMLRTVQPQSRFDDLDDLDFAAMAAPMGGRGVLSPTLQRYVAGVRRLTATG